MVRLILILAALWAFPAMGAEQTNVHLPGLNITLDAAGGRGEVATALKILFTLTILSLAPAILVVMTSFTRIIVVLAILRNALGMQQTPPNTVLTSLALFLTLFSMLPVFTAMNDNGLQPYLDGRVGARAAIEAGKAPLRDFMIRQTREKDLALMLEVAKAPRPESVEDVSILMLAPAFLLSELKTAFQIGFVIFLPFVLIDVVVASVLMSMGMLMVPPMSISLPIKIMMFVLIDGWYLVVHSLMLSFK